LAILPSALILIGAVIAVSRFIRKPSIELFLLLAFSATIALAIIGLTLAVSHTQVKAFYGLSALVAICYFGALGWGVIERRSKTFQFAFTIIFAVWALNSFASVWIRPTADQHIYAGTFFREQHQPATAAAVAIKAVETDPTSARARRFHALVLDDARDYSEALEEARQSIQLAPTDSNACLQAGHALINLGQTEQALDEARHAIEIGPENSIAYELLLICLVQLDRTGETIDAARDALAVSPFEADLHQTLAQAASRQGDFVTAAQQSGYALLFRPKWRAARTQLQEALISLGNRAGGAKPLREIAASAPDSPMMLNELAWLFATHPDTAWRDGAQALRLAERACALNDRGNLSLLASLAAAQAETGNFDEARKTAESALLSAATSGDERTTALLQTLLTAFRANLPYRASYP
jgi:tetratricopeptide (TPR) repeat protein